MRIGSNGSTNTSQSSVAYNLWKKLELMSRSLRYKDEAALIKEWVAAMERIANNTDVDNNGWKPWYCRTQIEQTPPRMPTCKDERGDMKYEENIQIERTTLRIGCRLQRVRLVD